MLAGSDWIGSEWLLDKRKWLDGVDGETSHTLELRGARRIFCVCLRLRPCRRKRFISPAGNRVLRHTVVAIEAFAYVIPNDQWDTYETGKLLSVLRMGGIEVNQSTKSFKVNNKKYPKGTYIVYTAQAFRPHLIDMMEPQSYPELKDANGNPKVPYDLAGWTLPLQMGVKVDRVNKSFEASTKSVNDLSISMPNGNISGNGKKGYILSANSNASLI